MTVEKILKRVDGNAVTVTPGTPVADTVEILRRGKVGVLAVTRENGEFLGLVSERDAIRGLAAQGLTSPIPITVAAIMSGPTTVCRPGDTLREVMTVMTLLGVNHIPVVDEGGLRGVVSLREIVDFRLEEARREVASAVN